MRTREAHETADDVRNSLLGYERQIAALKVELEVRTEIYANAFLRGRPERFNGVGRASAWDAGYEAAWRGKRYDNGYLRSHQQEAFQYGYEKGEADSRRKIDALLRAPGAQ